ncbi:MAG: AsmA family protein [Flavobacteriaceae bacterium]|nr:AsmA family protein [Flavobacteriaceae bacterium]
MKKFFKIFIGFIVVLLVALIALPIVFQDKIIAVVKEKINENVNAKVEFTDADLSLLRNFPNASVKLTDISVVNHEPFKGDTLFFSKEVNLKMSLTDIIKSKFNVKSFVLNDSKVTILVDKNGKTNYDIAKKTNETQTETNNEKAMKIAVEFYEVNHLDLIYKDLKSKMFVKLTDLKHYGSGDLSVDKTTLDTKTSTKILFKKDGKSYIENLHLDLKALLDLDFKNQKFAFLENTAHINNLPLIFDGFVKLNAKNQEVNLNFKTPSSDFRNFLDLVPKQYAKNTESVQTTGNFEIKGKINGIVDDKHIPKIDVNITSNNASFKFPNLPKGVKNIHINTDIKNNSGIVEDTYVDVKNFAFKIDNNEFNAKANIKRLTTNPLVNATLKGKLNLADINKVYPLEKEVKLSGLINADLTTNFDADAVQKSIPERIKNNGKISVNNFMYSAKGIVNPLNIKNAEVDFQPTKISLTNFDAKTGDSDFKAKGTIEDLVGFLLADKKLKGNFVLTSNTFKVSDFMQDNQSKETKKEDKKTTPNSSESLKIPAFLDVVTQVTAKNVYYDNLQLKNVVGKLILKDEKAVLQDLKANMFDGKIALNGTVNTKEKTPVFNMKMGIKDFNIASSFKSIEMLEKLAPIAEIISGKFNTNIDLNGKLTQDFTPDLNTIGGNAFAELLNQGLNPEKSKVMNLLDSQLKFIDLKKLNLNDIKTHLTFKDGKVNVKPFKVKYKDIDINIGGSHGFDQSMDYKISLDVPAKYLGSEVSGLLAKLDKSNQNMKVPITANLTGSFTNPSVKTDLKSAVTNLSNQLIEQQKNKLKNKAVEEINKRVKNKVVGDAINGILGKKTTDNKKKSDKKETTEDAVKEGVKNILGGFLGGKKKK